LTTAAEFKEGPVEKLFRHRPAAGRASGPRGCAAWHELRVLVESAGGNVAWSALWSCLY